MATTPNLGLELTAANETSKLFSAYRNGMSDNNVASNLMKIDTAIGLLNNKISGKNLLHNWDFRNPVNQRGATTANGSWQCLIDGWYIYRYVSGTASLSETGITINGDYDFGETLENFTLPVTANLPITISCKLANGNIFYKTSTLVNDGSTELVELISSSPAFKLTFIRNWEPGKDLFFFTSLTETVTISAVKLELGSVSTLANDPPADFGEELQKCKWYYRLWTTEAARTEALKEVGLMRLASPTTGLIVIEGVTYYYADADL
jgi:hypothetical protein